MGLSSPIHGFTTSRWAMSSEIHAFQDDLMDRQQLLDAFAIWLSDLIGMASAKLDLNQQISSHPDSQLITKAGRFSTKEWIDEGTRNFLRRFQKRFKQ